MITVKKFIKQLNNTELGKGSTHDTYILIPQDVSIKGIFDRTENWIAFKDSAGGESIDLKNTEGREKRIVGLGEYYRRNDLAAGDEIILQRIVSGDDESFIVGFQKYENCLTIQRFKDNFEILTESKLPMAQKWSEIAEGFSIEYLREEHKRSDSPETTSLYRVLVGGKNIAGKYKNKDMIILKLQGNKVLEWKSTGWKQIEFEMEG